MDKQLPDGLPTYNDATATATTLQSSWTNRRRRRRGFRIIATACLAYFAYSTYRIAANTEKTDSTLSVERLQEDYTVCSALRRKPTGASGTRDQNKRWISGTRPLLIRNATVWTGEPAAGTSEEDARAGKGWSWTSSDVFVEKGLIVEIRSNILATSLPTDTVIFEANGRLLTAGIVDMHSHAGLSSEGNLQDDTNEMSTNITPFVR